MSNLDFVTSQIKEVYGKDTVVSVDNVKLPVIVYFTPEESFDHGGVSLTPELAELIYELGDYATMYVYDGKICARLLK